MKNKYSTHKKRLCNEMHSEMVQQSTIFSCLETYLRKFFNQYYGKNESENTIIKKW